MIQPNKDYSYTTKIKNVFCISDKIDNKLY